MIQSRNAINLYAARGVAVREFPLDTGKADYLLFVDRKAVEVVEAKPEGVTLSMVGDVESAVEAGLARASRLRHIVPLREAVLQSAFEGMLS